MSWMDDMADPEQRALLVRYLQDLEIPVTLHVGFLHSEIGTLIPDGPWEGDDVLVSLAGLLEETARTIRLGMRDRGCGMTGWDGVSDFYEDDEDIEQI